MIKMQLFAKKTLFAMIWMIGASLLFSACSDDDDDTPAPTPTTDQTITEIVVESNDYTLLERALLRASGDLATVLSSGAFTVFAPNDAAFTAAGLTESVIDTFDQATLEAILTYHVIGSDITSLSSGDLNTVEGTSLNVNVSSTTVLNGNVNVNTTSITASNGTIYPIDAVLTLPTQDVTGLAIASPDLSTLVSALQAANLVTALQDTTTDFTVLAPTNAAFTELLTQLGAASLNDIPVDLLTQILTYHVIPNAKVFSTDLVDGSTPTTLNGANVTVNLNGGVFFESLNQSEVANPATDANLLATNGVVHVIDKVLLPIADLTLDQVVKLGDDFSTLELAVDAAGLSSLLADTTLDATVFAPDNAAFTATNLDLAALGNLTSAQAAEIIGYHVLPTRQVANDFSADQDFATLAVLTPDSLDIYVSPNNGVFINPNNPGQNIQVTTADLSTKNGVIHVINKVILPPSQQFANSGTIEDAVVTLSDAASPEFTQLRRALAHAGLLGVLTDTLQSYTVFAPTDAAFQNLYTALGVDSVEQVNTATLATILQYHIVGAQAKVYSNNLSDMQTVAMFGGTGDITVNVGNSITLTDGDTSNTDATVASPNVIARNGVIHIIDAVLLPAP